MHLISWFLYNFIFAAIFNKEDDIGTYTIKAVDDPKTLNKILYIRPPGNIYSFNDLVALWEKKIGKTLEKIYVPEDQVLKNIQGKWKFALPKVVRGIYLLHFKISHTFVKLIFACITLFIRTYP